MAFEGGSELCHERDRLYTDAMDMNDCGTLTLALTGPAVVQRATDGHGAAKHHQQGEGVICSCFYRVVPWAPVIPVKLLPTVVGGDTTGIRTAALLAKRLRSFALGGPQYLRVGDRSRILWYVQSLRLDAPVYSCRDGAAG